MDPLTHSATGYFLAKAGLDRAAPQSLWILLLAANAPDADIVAAFRGAENYLKYHRHFTHAIPMMPVVALLPVLIARLTTRKPLPWGRAYGISLAGVASHLALDATNIYGIRLLLPFSPRWYHLDLTSVVDLWIWGVFLVAFLGPLLVRLVNAEIGAKGRPGRGFAVLALLFLPAYNWGHWWLHERAVATLESRMYGGASALRVAAFPGPFHPLRWRGLVETAESYNVYEVSLMEPFDPSRGRTFYKAAADPVLASAEGVPLIRDFLSFAQFPFWRIAPTPEGGSGTVVEVMDMRFGTPAEPAFVASVVLDHEMRPIGSSFRFGRALPR